MSTDPRTLTMLVVALAAGVGLGWALREYRCNCTKEAT